MTPEQSYWLGVIVTISITFIAYSILRGHTMTEKQLRHMNAIVYTRNVNGYPIHILQSYYSVVAAWYPTASMLYLSPHFDCSQTTKKHVRAFMADYAGIDFSIKELKAAVNVGRPFDGEVMRANIGGHDLWVMLVREYVLHDILQKK